MQAAVLWGENDLRVQDWEKPVPKAGEALVRVKNVGICGSDMPRVLQGTAHSFPIILGHEFSGVVEAVGENVEQVRPGMRVAAAPLVPCHECEDCRAGNYSLCGRYSFIGSRVNGAWAQYVCVPERNLVEIPDNVSFVEGALFEPLTVALHGLLLLGLGERKDEKLAIIGMGTIGLLTLQAARLLGAKDITVFDIDDARLEAARELGATAAYNTASDTLLSDIDAATNKRGFPLVAEAAGVAATEKLALALAGKKSRVMYIGTPSRPVTLEPAEFERINRKELWLSGSWMSYSAPFPGREWTLAVEAFANGFAKADSVLDRILPLSQIGDAFADIAAGRVKGKIMLEVE